MREAGPTLRRPSPRSDRSQDQNPVQNSRAASIGIEPGPRASKPRPMGGCRTLVLLAAGGYLAACRASDPPPSPSDQRVAAASPEAPASVCPGEPVPSTRSVGTLPRHEQAATWLDRLPGEGADTVLVPPSALAGLNARFSTVVGAWRDIDDAGIGDPQRVDAAIEDRMGYLRSEVVAGRLVEADPGALDSAAAVVEGASAVDHQRLVRAEAALHCVPLERGLFRVPVDEDFDRNACASLHPAERVRVLRRGPKGHWLYVHAGHTVGWLHRASLSPRLSRADIDAWTQVERLVPIRDDVQTDSGLRIRLGVDLPLLGPATDGGWRVLAPGPEGLEETRVAATQSVSEGHPALTRRAVFEAAFAELGDPYGWGGRAGERDCSRFLRDLMATFGLQLARHSGVQAELGVRNVEVSEMEPRAKRAAIRRAGEQGVVLLYMRGHIMLYLGSDGERDYAISSISEYLEPCEGGEPTTRRIDRIAVSTLALGEGTPRTSFLERIARLVIFEPPAADAPGESQR